MKIDFIFSGCFDSSRLFYLPAALGYHDILKDVIIMDREQKDKLYRFFSDQAEKLLQEIDREIAAVGGESKLISRIDILHWVYYSRDRLALFQEICRMLEEDADGLDLDMIEQKMQKSLVTGDLTALRYQMKNAVSAGAVSAGTGKGFWRVYHKQDIMIQSPMGGTISVEDIAAKIPAEAKTAYVRVDENTVYWDSGEEKGKASLF